MSKTQLDGGKTGEATANAASANPLVADFRNVVADAEALLKATAQQGGEELDALRARARKSISKVNEGMAESGHAIVSGSRKAVRASNAFVHRHPWYLALAASGVALAVGVLIARR